MRIREFAGRVNSRNTGPGQVRQVVSASTPSCLASPTSMRPATLPCVILRGPHLQGRVRPRRLRRLCRHADEASGREVSRPAPPLPCNLSFLAGSRIPASSSQTAAPACVSRPARSRTNGLSPWLWLRNTDGMSPPSASFDCPTAYGVPGIQGSITNREGQQTGARP